jgi:hypothetical protein
MRNRKCEVCGSPKVYCTNTRCLECHNKYCTPGDDTSPGHGRGNPPKKSA